MQIFLSSKPLKVTFVLLFIALFLGIILFSLTKKSTDKVPPAPAPVQTISPLQKTSIGKTNQQEVEGLPGISQPKKLPDGSLKYTISSEIPQRPDEVIIKNNQVIFERINTPETPPKKINTKVSDYISAFGQPEKTIQGSRFYGPFASTYIYSSKGFTLIGNPNIDYIFEIQIFLPTTTDEYIRTYGQDIKEGLPNPEIPTEE